MIVPALLALVLQTSPAPVKEPPAEPEIRHGSSGEIVVWKHLLQDLATRDAVFLGELHDNDVYHRFQLDVFRELATLRPDRVLSTEMFERDTQGILADYLRGRLSEEEFLRQSRPWKNYEPHYRPLIELARAAGTDVLAANVPRRLAAAINREGPTPFQPRFDTARTFSHPEDAYFDRFVEVMQDHLGAAGADAMSRMYAAQCLKDDTMAESIADYLELHPHRDPLVVHLCGNFHSDFGLGTVSRLLERRPVLSIGIVTALAVDEEQPFDFEAHRGRAHYLILVPPPEKPPEEEAEEAPATEEPAIPSPEEPAS
jgi:uncharacterized iron-regulated protein